MSPRAWQEVRDSIIQVIAKLHFNRGGLMADKENETAKRHLTLALAEVDRAIKRHKANSKEEEVNNKSWLG